MPELPEVETLCRQLDATIRGAALVAIVVYDRKLCSNDARIGKKVLGARRRGKEILIFLRQGPILRIHLRMSGRLLWKNDGQEPPHTRCKFVFDGGSLHFVDPRRFGTLAACRNLEDLPAVPDPLGEWMTDAFIRTASARRLAIKSFLLDQNVIAGIGNIYACEILFQSGIHPWRRTADMTRGDWIRIRGAADAVLKKAIDCRGTTISDWTDLYGRKGSFQNHLRVYGREGKRCRRCSSSIAREVMNGRGTYYCPTCQIP